MPPLVLERHRPTLRELVAPLPRRARRALAALAALVVVAIVVLALGAEGRGPQFVHRVAPEFNFAYGSVLKRERPQDGEYVRLVRRRGDVFVQSFAVEPLRLPAYDGDVGGILPIVADARIAELRRRHPGFE
ncbi:MAG: hypothetical protein ACXWZZ_12695, partial [Solirubrobacteraceae bacterium]